jgi:hypothetical protein
MMTLNDGRTELWQWDTGRTLAVDNECSQVHFGRNVYGRSIDVDVVDGVAYIPDVLLQTDKELTAWAFVGTPENGYTKISKTFNVNHRNKPADYVFTPPEQTSLAEIKDRLKHLEEIQDPDAIKNAVEDYLEKNPVESPVQSVNGKIGKVSLNAADVGAISQDDLQKATNEALSKAKESGEFDGEPGKDGDDYVLTDADKQEIAEIATEMVEVPEYDGKYIPAPETAAVGQTVVVKAVDETGKPTQWEAADMRSGGSSNGYTLLNSLTLSEETRIVEFTSDLSGNPFEVEDLLILLRTTPMEGASEKCQIQFVFFTGTQKVSASLTNAVWTGTTQIGCSSTIIKPYASTMFRMSCIRNGETQPATAFGAYDGSLTADSYVDKIQVFIPTSANHSFGVGTTIEVYGR